jgi:two-component system chemotaxis sensor kinase CheA
MQEVARKSADLEKASQYKSEFLANMSHEIRTPLNSLLILSKSLEENQEGNLTDKQMEAARVIYAGGQELLTLINDILDLSKIEAGKLSPQWESIEIRTSLDYLRKQFDPIAQDKALALDLLVEDKVPTTIITDEQRLVQILRNLLSNAFKFTSAGRVELRVEVDLASGEGNGTDDLSTIAFTISDTGIGIAEELLTSVFEAFQQGDGSTSRRYGGTGLGLTISRELAALLGGQLTVQSRVGEGSQFTLRLPLSDSAAASGVTAASRPQSERRSVGDVCEVRSEAASNACELLVIGEGTFPQQTVGALQEVENVNATTASSGREGLALLQAHRYDCLVLDLQLSDIPGAELLKIIDETPSVTFPQTILCTEQELSGDELHALQGFSQTLVLKSENASQRLQEEVRLVSRKLDDSLPPAPPGVRNLSETDMALEGKKVLIVDDDVRNTYALSHALDERGLDVVMADNGQLALEKLEHEDDIALVVMDIMMPGMDGYEAMRRIRGMQRYAKVPIIALTAKAMPEDHSKCIASGANDNLTKPVDVAEMLSMMKTWLDRR